MSRYSNHDSLATDAPDFDFDSPESSSETCHPHEWSQEEAQQYAEYCVWADFMRLPEDARRRVKAQIEGLVDAAQNQAVQVEAMTEEPPF